MLVTRKFNLQPGSLAAGLAGLCQPNRKNPSFGIKAMSPIRVLLGGMKDILRACLGKLKSANLI
eukprot:1157352-Pelagomonas_calceolata.AAC.5